MPDVMEQCQQTRGERFRGLLISPEADCSTESAPVNNFASRFAYTKGLDSKQSYLFQLPAMQPNRNSCCWI